MVSSNPFLSLSNIENQKHTYIILNIMGWTQTTFKLENAEFSIVHNMDEVDVQNCFDNWIVRTVLKTRTNFLTYISEIEGVDFEAFHDWNELNTIHKTV